MFHSKRRPASILASLLLVSATSLVFAGGSAVIETGGKGDSSRSTIEYDNNQQLRMNFGTGEQSYMVMRDDRIYMVMDQGGEQPLVMDLGSTMKMLGSSVQEAMKNAQASPSNMEAFISLKDTGDNETVAGIKGDVYTLKYKDHEGKVRTESLVLSSDERARDLAEAMQLMGTTMSKAFGNDVKLVDERFYTEVSDGSRGFLRMGENFKIASFDEKTPAKERFELPAQPTQMPDLGSMFGAGASSDSDDGEAGEQEKKGFSLGGLFKKKADRQQERTEDKVDDAIDDATDDAIDSAVDNVLGRIFGR